MKKLNYIAIIVFLSLFVVFCAKEEIVRRCKYPFSIYSRYIGFFIIDKHNRNLIADFNTVYDYELISITNFDSTKFEFYDIYGDGLIRVIPTYGEEKDDTIYHRDFLVQFPGTAASPYYEQDTLSFEFLVSHKCSTIWYDSIWIYYNNELQYRGAFSEDYLRLVKK
jgi:hypothetical protein